jgi:nitroreductase
MNALTLLTERNSAPKLTAPAPSVEELHLLFSAALRAPDHARLRPWRFLTVSGEARHNLGELYAKATLARNSESTEQELDKVRQQPLRAPLIVVVIASISEHEKVPREEQLLSAGCAAHSILLAAQAMGYGAIWRTGPNAFDRNVMAGLGLAENEEVVGYIYLGTVDGKAKPLVPLAVDDFVQQWQAW